MRLIDADKLRLSYWVSPTSTVSTAGQYYFYSQDEVDNAPTIDAEPVRHGRWMSSQAYAEVGECYCSKCETVYYADDLYNVGETDENGVGQALMPNYCPHCGAKMDEVTE